MKDRNEWFEEVERAYSKLKIVERPYAPPHAAVAVEAEDVLCCLGLHPHISASDWLVIKRALAGPSQCDERDVSLLRDVQQYRVGELDGDAAKRGRRHARGRLEQPVIRSATDLFRATAWRTVPDLVSGPARRALVHGRADAPRVTSAQIGETERRARALERDRARALKRSRKAKR